ncbi:MAG: hypothetical protein J3Q66DRAFT_37198 [Benniella sp.]|nr:MAG: hypothetical protein J3Q66DRAFT_37198 [Benniella sp.]
MSAQEPSATTLEPEQTTETTEPPPTIITTPGEPPLTTTDHEPQTTPAVSYSTHLPWTPTVSTTEVPSRTPSTAPWTPTLHHTTPFTTQYITTVSVITITTLIPQTTVISGSVVTIYSTKITTTRIPTVIPDPNQPPPASYIFTGEHGLKPWQISLIIIAALVLISACAAVFLVTWIRRRKKTGTRRNEAEGRVRGDDILMPIGLEPWNDPATAAAVMGSPNSGRASGMWHEYDKEGAYDAAGAAMMSGSTIAGTAVAATTTAAAATATSPILEGYPERYFETTGGGGGGGSGYFYGHGQEFSDDYYELADPGGHGYPLSPYHQPSPPHHRHYRHEPHELSQQPSIYVHNGHPYSGTFDTLPASFQDDSTRSYPTFYPQPPAIYVSRTTQLPSSVSVIGSPQATVFTMPDDSILSNKMSVEGMETDKAASISVATMESGDLSEEAQQQHLERNAKVEMRRNSPHALLPVRQPQTGGGAMEEFPHEGSSRGSRSSGEFMISGDEFGGHSKVKTKEKENWWTTMMSQRRLSLASSRIELEAGMKGVAMA